MQKSIYSLKWGVTSPLILALSRRWSWDITSLCVWGVLPRSSLGWLLSFRPMCDAQRGESERHCSPVQICSLLNHPHSFLMAFSRPGAQAEASNSPERGLRSVAYMGAFELSHADWWSLYTEVSSLSTCAWFKSCLNVLEREVITLGIAVLTSALL